MYLAALNKKATGLRGKNREAPGNNPKISHRSVSKQIIENDVFLMQMTSCQ
jgi:hypothetical protein